MYKRQGTGTAAGNEATAADAFAALRPSNANGAELPGKSASNKKRRTALPLGAPGSTRGQALTMRAFFASAPAGRER